MTDKHTKKRAINNEIAEREIRETGGRFNGLGFETQKPSKLPQATSSMQMAEGLTLETFHMLIEAGIVPEEVAVKKYNEMKAKYTSWSRYK